MSKPGPAILALAPEASRRVPTGYHIDLSRELSWETGRMLYQALQPD